MKKPLLVFAALCAFASATAILTAAEPATMTFVKAQTDFKTVTVQTTAEAESAAKELADTKAALATAQNAQQSSAIAAEYYKALSEKNDALLRLMQAQVQLADLQSQLAAARSEIADLKAPPKKPAPSPAK